MIQKSASTVENLAHSLNLDRRGLAVLWTDWSFGILDKEAERYSVKAEYTELLDSRSSKTLVPMLAHWGTCQRAWSQLAHVVRTGHPAPKVAGTFGPYADDQAFILGMNSIAGPLAAQIAADLAAVGITGFRQMLDLGGASGTYTLAFLRAGIAQAGVIFDRPVGIMAAQERLGRQENEVFRNRVSLVSGDFYRDSYPPECDFHWISAIIHQQDLDATRAMFAESYRHWIPAERLPFGIYLSNPTPVRRFQLRCLRSICWSIPRLVGSIRYPKPNGFLRKSALRTFALPVKPTT